MDTLTRMRAFVEVVDAQGFSAAARKMGRSKALLSKYVRELEDELGVLLLNRTTRKFSLTSAGRTYRAEAADILERIETLQDALSDAGKETRGTLRVTAPRSLTDVSEGIPVHEFMLAYPEIRLEMVLDDSVVDLIEGGFDVALRLSSLTDSTLIARKLTTFRGVFCASPEALKKFGTPKHPRDLSQLPCVIDTNYESRGNWPFRERINGEEISFAVPVSGPLEVNSPFVARRGVLNGNGFGMLPEFAIEEDLKSGALVSVLEEFAHPPVALHAVYPHRRHVPAKLRVFVDFLAEWFKKKGR